MQPIFSRNKNANKIAFMNWRMQENSRASHFINIAAGYLQSSIILAKQCLICNSDKRADILIFPILANANHGIELYLKAMVIVLNQSKYGNAKIEGGHNIYQIYRMLKSKIKTQLGPEELNAFKSRMIELEHYLKELVIRIEATSKNNKMDFSRYPTTATNENHFYVDGIVNEEVDLENFIQRFEIIDGELRSIAEHYYDTLLAEHQQEQIQT